MRDISRRVKNVEKRLNLNLNEKPETVRIVLYGGELPPDRTEDGIRYVHYKDIKQEARAGKRQEL